MSEASSPRTEASAPVEEKMVTDPSRVRHRDKHVARTAAVLMIPMALLALLATVAVASGADPAAPRLAALIPFAGFLGTLYMLLTRMVVRSAVTRDEVQVQWGLSEHRIPLAAITACEAKPATGGPTAATGAGWALFANRGSVLITWSEGGTSKSLSFPANDPVTVAAQIEAARGGQASGVRVAADADEALAVEAGAEASREARARR